MKKSRSLTGRVLGTVLLLELVAATLLIAASVVHEWRSRLVAFDVMLAGRADTMLGAVADAEDAADNVVLNLNGLTIPKGDLYWVRDDRSGLLGHSQIDIPAGILSQANASERTLAVRIDGRHYRIIRLRGIRVVDPGDPGGGVRHTVTVFYASRTSHIWHDVIKAVRFYAIATVLLFSITTLVMVWLLRRDLAPLRQLAAEAGKVSAKNWAFRAPLAAKETKELLPLAQAIEAALARLQRSFEQQRRLTNDAAHELKTDVAIAKSSLQLLAMRTRTIREYESGLEVCLDDCNRLERTVQQMLTLARVEHAESNLEARQQAGRCSLLECIQASIQKMGSLAELRRVELVLMADGDPLVGVDRDDCSILFSNLLMNALQHSPAGSTVSVGLEASTTRAIVTIQDRGEGIAPSDLEHVFEPFYRGDSSRSRESGGTGLGLAICNAICERAKGSIRIECPNDRGTKVTIDLPVVP
jgi:signal transduction histidine kinase